jgi:hypothetical protein
MTDRENVDPTDTGVDIAGLRRHEGAFHAQTHRLRPDLGIATGGNDRAGGVAGVGGDSVSDSAESDVSRSERQRLIRYIGRLETERAALRFSEREWRDKAQDKTAECEELKARMEELEGHGLVNIQLQARIERLEALVAKWRAARTVGAVPGRSPMVDYMLAADELEAALSSAPTKEELVGPYKDYSGSTEEPQDMTNERHRG